MNKIGTVERNNNVRDIIAEYGRYIVLMHNKPMMWGMFTFLVVQLSGCGATVDSDTPGFSGTPTDTLYTADVLSLPDGEMILDVSSVCFDSEGSIYFLDRLQCRIEKFDPDGHHIRSISQKGDGPGEISSPNGFAVLGNDKLLVIDSSSMRCHIFSTDGEYLGSSTAWESSVPGDIHALGDSSYVGTAFNVLHGDQGVSISCTIGRYTSSSEPDVNYFTRSWNWTPESSHIIYEDYERILYTASSDNRFFLVPDAGEYLVQVYGTEGEILHNLQRSDLQRVLKPDSVIDLERELFERHAVQDQAYAGGYDPDEHYPLIRSLGVDSQGNLWVQRGDTHPQVIFDVWDPDGEPLKTVIVGGTYPDQIEKCRVGSGGIIAYTQDSGSGMVLFSLK